MKMEDANMNEENVTVNRAVTHDEEPAAKNNEANPTGTMPRFRTT